MAAGSRTTRSSRFPEYVDNVVSMMSPGGVGLQVNGRLHALNATPAAVSVPPVWLLGSSDYSARLAASRGLPYVFAHHFSGQGTAEALELYRSSFQPSSENPTPRTFLTVNAVVASSQEEADRLALPQLQAMVALRTGQPLQPAAPGRGGGEGDGPRRAPEPARVDVAPLGDRDTRLGGRGDPRRSPRRTTWTR